MGRFSVPTYRDAPGLRRFPPEQQFIIYRGAHRKLLSDDPAYRKECLRYTMLIVGLFLVSAALQILPVLGFVRVTVTVLVGILSVILVVACAFRAQRYRNLRVDWELQKQELSKV